MASKIIAYHKTWDQISVLTLSVTYLNNVGNRTYLMELFGNLGKYECFLQFSFIALSHISYDSETYTI